jgi:hypothetical protein
LDELTNFDVVRRPSKLAHNRAVVSSFYVKLTTYSKHVEKTIWHGGYRAKPTTKIESIHMYWITYITDQNYKEFLPQYVLDIICEREDDLK